MTWNKWYAFRSSCRASLWIVPFIALLLEQVTFRVAYALDARFTWIPPWPFGLSGTQTALQTIITLVLSFIVFTFASLLVAIQVASGQLTPRIIATTLLRNNVIRLTVGLFVFTLLFALGTVARIETTVPGRHVDCGNPRVALDYGLSFSHRLLSPAVAPGQHPMARRRERSFGRRERVS